MLDSGDLPTIQYEIKSLPEIRIKPNVNIYKYMYTIEGNRYILLIMHRRETMYMSSEKRESVIVFTYNRPRSGFVRNANVVSSIDAPYRSNVSIIVTRFRLL